MDVQVIIRRGEINPVNSVINTVSLVIIVKSNYLNGNMYSKK